MWWATRFDWFCIAVLVYAAQLIVLWIATMLGAHL